MVIGWGFGSGDDFGNSSIDYATNAHLFFGTDGISVRTSTQPESLILAQSERWRQA
jgi:hypothetical protein